MQKVNQKDQAKQKRIFVPTKCIHDWKELLADPEKQWKRGYSAMSIAESWEKSQGIPDKIKEIFTQSRDPRFSEFELLFATPEYKVMLEGGRRPSQNDVFAVIKVEDGIMAMTVEGKAREDFGPTLGEWKQKTSVNGAQKRLEMLKKNLNLTEEPPDIRYQLLHRTASSVIEAKKFHAVCAAMVVQSFVESKKENHYEDFQKFVKLFQPEYNGGLIHLTKVQDIDLYAGWVWTEVDFTTQLPP
jgi:Rad3-related DNA helicase